jgi:hypothetical protein
MTIARQSRGRLTEGQSRHRLTKAEQAELDAALIAITEELNPITVRGVFYQTTVRIPLLVPKDQKGYGLVQRRLVKLREWGKVPYGHITDGTRWRHGRTRYEGLKDFQAHAASLYRRDYWAQADVHVEVWIEKDALAGVIFPTVVDEWGLDLMVNKGFASRTYLFEAGEYLAALDKPTHIYILSDFDSSGKCAARKVEVWLRRFAPRVELHVHDLAVTKPQIVGWDLPSRPMKTGKGTHGGAKFAKEHGDRAVELDAIRPDRLRQLVSDAIEGHADVRQIEQLKDIEYQEKKAIRQWEGLKLKR